MVKRHKATEWMFYLHFNFLPNRIHSDLPLCKILLETVIKLHIFFSVTVMITNTFFLYEVLIK